MNRYELICKLDKDFLILIKNGLIPVHLLGWKTIYELYLKEIKFNNKSTTCFLVADEFNLSEKHIRSIVKFMSD